MLFQLDGLDHPQHGAMSIFFLGSRGSVLKLSIDAYFFFQNSFGNVVKSSKETKGGATNIYGIACTLGSIYSGSICI